MNDNKTLQANLDKSEATMRELVEAVGDMLDSGAASYTLKSKHKIKNVLGVLARYHEANSQWTRADENRAAGWRLSMPAGRALDLLSGNLIRLTDASPKDVLAARKFLGEWEADRGKPYPLPCYECGRNATMRPDLGNGDLYAQNGVFCCNGDRCFLCEECGTDAECQNEGKP